MPASEGPGDPGTAPDEAPGDADRPAVEGGEASGVLRKAARSAVLLTAAGLVGQVFTLVRELFIAGEVGVAEDLDALLVAAVAPMMLAGFLASGTSAAIVPGYLGTLRDRGRGPADGLLGALLTWTLILGTALTALVIVGAEVAVTVAGPGLDEAARELAIGFVPIVAPILVLTAAASILAAAFQIHDRMRGIAVAWMVGPVASVIVTVGLWEQLGLVALALAMTAQQAVIVGVLVGLGLRFRILPRPALRARGAEAGVFVRHAAPLTISASILNFNLLTDRAIATLITPGGVSALRYAEGVIRIPMNAIGPAWSAAIYPALVRVSLLADGRSFADSAAGALRYILAIFVPLSVATGALAPVIVDLAYVRGAFDDRAAVLTSAALLGFAPLLVLTMVQSVLVGAHNARRQGMFLLAMGVLNAFLNVILNVGLGLLIGIAGVALSTSLTMGLIQVINAWRLGRIERDFRAGPLLVVSAKALAASVVVAIPIALIAWSLPHGLGVPLALAALVLLTAAGMAGYLGVSRLIGLGEPLDVARTVLRAPRLVRGRS